MRWLASPKAVPRLCRHILAGVVLLCLATAAGAATQVAAPVTLLVDHDYAVSLLDALRSSRESIVCSFYLFKIGDRRNNLPLRIADELIRAGKRGVQVQVLLEYNGRSQDRLDDENMGTAAYLLRGGIRVRFDSPRTTSHAKVVVIDHRILFLGSHNLTQSALVRNREFSVRIDSPRLAKEAEESLLRE